MAVWMSDSTSKTNKPEFIQNDGRDNSLERDHHDPNNNNYTIGQMIDINDTMQDYQNSSHSSSFHGSSDDDDEQDEVSSTTELVRTIDDVLRGMNEDNMNGDSKKSPIEEEHDDDRIEICPQENYHPIPYHRVSERRHVNVELNQSVNEHFMESNRSSGNASFALADTKIVRNFDIRHEQAQQPVPTILPMKRGHERVSRTRALNTNRFPEILHRLLEESEIHQHQDIIAWQEDGRSFRIYDADRFVQEVMPKYFKKQTKLRSFQRQLLLYGWTRIVSKKGPEYNCYSHEKFVRGCTKLATEIRRMSNSKQPPQTGTAIGKFKEKKSCKNAKWEPNHGGK
jgi:HSF-type DNA-binding